MHRNLPLKRVLLILVAGLALLAAVCALMAWQNRAELAPVLEDTRSWLLGFLESVHPVAFFALMAVLPAFGFPLSPFYLLSSAYGVTVALAASAVAMAGNLLFSFWLAVGFCRPLIERFLRRYDYRIPEVGQANQVRVTLIIRLTPGLPFFVQNYVLALAGVRFRIYMMLSWLAQMAYAIAFIVLGESVFEGRVGLAVVAISLVIVLLIVTRIIRDRYARPDGDKPAYS